MLRRLIVVPTPRKTLKVSEEAFATRGVTGGRRFVAERAEDFVYIDKQLVIMRTPGGLSISGVIDNYNVDSFFRSLNASLGREGDVNVDLSELEFCDVSGIRALVRAAECLDSGRRLVLHGLPQQLRTVIKLVGWTDLPGLMIGELGADE